ncbi:MAG: hypothetical protein P1P84_22700 [Deferrisomatales bacterium]|nr:hypothetical protein [Deferrisomatales bacterium]
MTSCNRCGVDLAAGSLKYLVTVNVTADFDGVLPTQVELEDLEAFMRQLDSEDPAKAENDVYLSRGYVLCPACKAAFLADPLGTRAPGDGPRPGPGDGDAGGKVH